MYTYTVTRNEYDRLNIGNSDVYQVEAHKKDLSKDAIYEIVAAHIELGFSLSQTETRETKFQDYCSYDMTKGEVLKADPRTLRGEAIHYRQHRDALKRRSEAVVAVFAKYNVSAIHKL